MKRHLFFTLLTMALAVSFSSCLKDEMKDSSTIIYGSQKIPNINKFMPSHLLQMMDSLSVIHYGDEPPRFSGHYHIDELIIKHVRWENDSVGPAHQNLHEGNIAYNNLDIYFYDQVKCIISSRYDNVCQFGSSSFTNMSNPDTTYHYFKDSFAPIANTPDKPSYFENNKYDKDDFSHAYIIGSGKLFTIFYYDVETKIYPQGMNMNNFLKVSANIISGELKEFSEIVPNANDSTVTDTVSRYRIDNFTWGKEYMGYFRETSALERIISQGGQPRPGDVSINTNANGGSLFPIND